jgi:hypothetical protein
MRHRVSPFSKHCIGKIYKMTGRASWCVKLLWTMVDHCDGQFLAPSTLDGASVVFRSVWVRSK